MTKRSPLKITATSAVPDRKLTPQGAYYLIERMAGQIKSGEDLRRVIHGISISVAANAAEEAERGAKAREDARKAAESDAKESARAIVTGHLRTVGSSSLRGLETICCPVRFARSKFRALVGEMVAAGEIHADRPGAYVRYRLGEAAGAASIHEDV